MDIKTIGTFFAILVSILTAGKIIIDLTIGHKVKSREQYRFAKEFLNDLSKEKDLHPAIPFVEPSTKYVLYAWFITFPLFGFYAVWSLRLNIKIRAAEYIVHNQVASRPNCRRA